VLDGVRIFQIGRLEVSLEVVYQRSCLVLEAAFGDPDILLVGAVLFLVVIIIAGRNRNPLRVPLSPLFAALHGALDGKVGWPRSATAGDHFPAAWGKDSPDRLLVSGILAGDVNNSLMMYLTTSFGTQKRGGSRTSHMPLLDTFGSCRLGPRLCPSWSPCAPRRRSCARCLGCASMYF
jgi:hypothetical protein